ncbi:unnamed protein product, partial [Schistosoma turkestanicum]
MITGSNGGKCGDVVFLRKDFRIPYTGTISSVLAKTFLEYIYPYDIKLNIDSLIGRLKAVFQYSNKLSSLRIRQLTVT